MKKNILFLIIALPTTIFAQFPIIKNNSDELERQNRIDKCMGKPFPAFQCKSLDGKAYSEEQLIGKITVINFWFELCAPCVAELNSLNNLYVKFQPNQKFQFLSFTRDDTDDAKLSVLKYELLFPVISISDEECYRLNCNSGFPTTIIVDQTGKIVFIKDGGHIEKQAVEEDINKLALLVDHYLKLK